MTTDNILVVTMGYYGRGSTVEEAAVRCHKAGSPLAYKAVVIIVNTEIKFIDAMSVGYPKVTAKDGVFITEEGHPLFRTEFTVKRLSAIMP